MKLLISLFVVALTFSLPVRAEDNCKTASEAMKRASVIRKLTIKKSVPCFVRTKEEVRNYILETIEKKIPPARIEMEELVYKAVGFIPESYDYAKGVVDLYLSQLGGYYDPERKHFVMAGWLPDMMQPTIAAHELTHALQDQYYNLGKMIEPSDDNSDAQLARIGLVEGDATAVMMDYLRELSGQGPIAKEKDVNSFMLQNVLGMSLTAGMSDVPHSLQMLLVFPYTSGLRFAHSLLLKDGYKSVDEAFKNPPRSTEEILHPEKYGTKKPDFITFTDEEVSKDGRGNEFKVIHRDTVGEFGISIALSMFIENKMSASEIASGWGGDKIIVTENADKKRAMVWRTHWDTPEKATAFYDAYREVLSKRFPDVDSKKYTGGDWIQSGASKLVKLHRSDLDVIVGIVL